jgi:death-on-curing protein
VTKPKWLGLTVVLAIHSDQIQEHGGSPGLRDRGVLESALARPMNTLLYKPDSDLCSLVASYGFGVARNHPFVDGNKRVAFQAMYVFLGLNGIRITGTEPEVVELVVALASSQIGQDEVTVWLRAHTVPR